MKTHYIALAVAALAIAACAETMEQPEITGKQTIIKAYQESALNTRTLVQEGGTQVYWEPGEEIKVFFQNTFGRFTSLNTEPAEVADFSGVLNPFVEANEGASSSNLTWGLYPYRDDATYDGASVTTTLPSEQTGRSGSFAKNTHITLACSEGNDLAFYNVSGGVRFSLVNSGVKQVIFEGADKEILAGTATISFVEGLPMVSRVENGETRIILNAPEDGCFDVGEWYYIEALPVKLENGFKLSFLGDGICATVNSSSAVEIKRGVYGSLNNVDARATYNQTTVIHYKTKQKKTATLNQSAGWYGEIISNTYDTENNLGTITFRSPQTVYYKLFSYSGDLTYLTIPEGIEKIDKGALKDLRSVDLVSYASPAPEINDTEFYTNNNWLNSFQYPDDADYLQWYYPGYRDGGSYYGNGYGLSEFESTIGTCPQTIIVYGCSQLSAPTITLGWEGNYLGRFFYTDGNDNECLVLLFDRKITKIPEKAFYYWRDSYYARFILSNYVSHIGDHAFEGAYISRLPKMRGVTDIAAYAFAVDSGQSYTYPYIDLPPSVKSIGEYSFKNSKAKKICTYGDRPTVASNAYYGIAEGGTVYYPSGKGSLYNSSTMKNWTSVSRNGLIVPDTMTAGVYILTNSSSVDIEFTMGDGYYVDFGSVVFDGSVIFNLDSQHQPSQEPVVITAECAVGKYVQISFTGNASSELKSVTGATVIGVCEGSNGNETFSFGYSGDRSYLQFSYHYWPEFYNNDYEWI